MVSGPFTMLLLSQTKSFQLNFQFNRLNWYHIFICVSEALLGLRKSRREISFELGHSPNGLTFKCMATRKEISWGTLLLSFYTTFYLKDTLFHAFSLNLAVGWILKTSISTVPVSLNAK